MVPLRRASAASAFSVSSVQNTVRGHDAELPPPDTQKSNVLGHPHLSHHNGLT